MKILWRLRYCFWMWSYNFGSGIPLGFYWRWSADDHGDQHPRDAAMDCSWHLNA